jgi:hypothetical protein
MEIRERKQWQKEDNGERKNGKREGIRGKVTMAEGG